MLTRRFILSSIIQHRESREVLLVCSFNSAFIPKSIDAVGALCPKATGDSPQASSRSPGPQQLARALANRILEQTEGSKTSEVDAIWDQEIRDRIPAYGETCSATRAASDVFSDLN